MSRRSSVLLVFLASLLLRLAFHAAWRGEPIAPDSASYLSVAANVAEGRGFMMDAGVPDSNRAPLYPALLAGIRLLFGGGITPILLAQALLDSLTAVWILLLATSLAGPRSGLLSGLVYALHPVFIGYTHWILSETFFFDLWFLSLWLTAQAWVGRRASLFACGGAALALAVLCRPAHMFYPAAILAALALGEIPWRRAAVCGAAFCAAFVLVLSPWTGRNWLRFHKIIPVVTGGGNAWYVGSLPDYPSIAQIQEAAKGDPFSPEGDRALSLAAKRNWRDHGPALAARLPRRLLKFWITSHCSVFSMDRTNADYRERGQWGALAFKFALIGLQILIVAAGIWGAWALRSFWRRGLLLLLMPAAYASLHILNDYQPNRYHLTALPCLWMLFFWALSERSGWNRKEKTRAVQ